MQLSLSSVPSDPMLSPLSGAGAEDCSSTLSPASAAAGFAQLLGGANAAVTPAPLESAPPELTLVGDALCGAFVPRIEFAGVEPSALTQVSGVAGSVAPVVTCHAGSDTPAEAVPVAPAVTATNARPAPDSSGQMGRRVPGGPGPRTEVSKSQSASKPDSPKSLSEAGDLQSLAVLLNQLPPMAAPVVKFSDGLVAEETCSSLTEPTTQEVETGAPLDARMMNRPGWTLAMLASNRAGESVEMTDLASPMTTDVPASGVRDSAPAPSTKAFEAAQLSSGTFAAKATVPSPATIEPPMKSPVAEIRTTAADGTTGTPLLTRNAATPMPVVPAANPVTVAQAAEKIAAPDDLLANSSSRAEKPDTKSFVVTNGRSLTKFRQAFGIDAALSPATMPAGAPQVRINTSDSAVVLNSTATADVRRETESVPSPVALPATAHKAVEAVLSTVDRFAARDQHSVDLQFSVGGNELKVRVELRGGEVHTTFRTDSDDLRSALSNEWQSVAAQSHADRPVRLAAPVFAAAQDSSASFSGDGATRDRQQENAGRATESDSGSFARRISSMSTGSAPAGAATAVRTVSANAVHLHTLA